MPFKFIDIPFVRFGDPIDPPPPPPTPKQSAPPHVYKPLFSIKDIPKEINCTLYDNPYQIELLSSEEKYNRKNLCPICDFEEKNSYLERSIECREKYKYVTFGDLDLD